MNHLIATGRTAPGEPYTLTATADALADIAIAELRAATWRVCQLLGIIPPDAQTGLAQHEAAVQAHQSADAAILTPDRAVL